jgi:glycosyltransferase involved in cell wall biosynthesis
MSGTIIIIEDSSKGKMGGGQELSLRIATKLKEKFDLILFDSKKKSVFQDRIKPLISDFLPLYYYGKIVGKPKSSFSIGLMEIVLSVFLFPTNFFRMYYYIRGKKISKTNTTIYAATKKALIYSYFIKFSFNITYIFHAHSMDDRKSLFFRMLQLPYKASNKIICDSNVVKDNIGLSNCLTIYNGIELRSDITPKKVPSDGKFIVASFANLIKLKGIKYLMKCHQYLKNKNIEIWIFGDGEEKENLIKYQNDKVLLKGYVDDIETVRRNVIHLTALPSVVAEAGPMTILESFSYGIPVIATDLGGQAEFVRNGFTGFHVPVRDPKAIAEKIDYLFENKDTYHTFSKNSLEYSKQFGMEQYGDKILNVIMSNLYHE